jgi:hypothetical protein
MAYKGIVEGLPTGSLAGDRPVTRYEDAIALARIARSIEGLAFPDNFGQATAESTVCQKTGFMDVPQGHWASVAVEGMAAFGLVEGFSDDRFYGSEPLNRSQLAVVLARMLERYMVCCDPPTAQ